MKIDLAVLFRESKDIGPHYHNSHVYRASPQVDSVWQYNFAKNLLLTLKDTEKMFCEG